MHKLNILFKIRPIQEKATKQMSKFRHSIFDAHYSLLLYDVFV